METTTGGNYGAAKWNDTAVLKAKIYYGDVTDATAFWLMRSSTMKEMVPEKRLLAAILIDAVDIVREYSYNRRRTSKYQDARRWFLSQNRKSLFSFHLVCLNLGIEAEVVLRRIRRYL